jgi:hypothetical protein
MPVWLRRFTFSKLREYYENQNKEEDPVPVKQSNKISPPDAVQKALTPSYSTKASNK